MTLTYQEYSLQDGYIHNWLVSGPGSAARANVEVDISQPPADRDEPVPGESIWRWKYARAGLDHLLDISSTAALIQGRAWAYAQLMLEQGQAANLVLTTAGPAKVWLAGQEIACQASTVVHGWRQLRFPVNLQPGVNSLWVQLDQDAEGGLPREARFAIAARWVDFSDPDSAERIVVRVPTHSERPDRIQRLERLLDYAYLDQVVNYRGRHFNLCWSDEIGEDLYFVYDLQDNQELIYVNGKNTSSPAKPVDVGQEYRVREAAMKIVLRATDGEFYEKNVRYTRALPIQIVDGDYSESPYSDFANRNQEALRDAVRHENDLFAEVAKMRLGLWKVENWTFKHTEVKPKVILDAIERIRRAEADSPLLLVGLCGIANWFQAAAEFPQELKAPLESCLRQVVFRTPVSESDAILMNTVAILAGQRYPEQIYPSGQTGDWHRQQAERQAINWLKQHGQKGFARWNSGENINCILTALAHLTNLAQNETIRELAAVLMDKIFFLLAVNSFKGALCASRGQTSAEMIKTHQLDATSGIQRMMWGMGTYNRFVAGMVSLICSGYEFPLLLAEIAADQPAELWSLERHCIGALAPDTDETVQTAVYKTPDYMLAAALDYRAGQPGNGEHVWQATLGPEAIVFVNHPGILSEKEAYPAGFWRGSAILPRVAQWKDTLISLVQLPADAWIGFTHAYFPTCSFDEYVIQDGWAFARKGSGYLALTARQGIELIKTAPDAYRELRSHGRENAWICQMGREELDGSFQDFQQKIHQLNLDWQPAGVSLTNLRGQSLAFAWGSPFMVNGQPQQPGSEKHIENPYCQASYPASQMDIGNQEYLIRLNWD